MQDSTRQPQRSPSSAGDTSQVSPRSCAQASSSAVAAATVSGAPPQLIGSASSVTQSSRLSGSSDTAAKAFERERA
jgi:hypothetical protein